MEAFFSFCLLQTRMPQTNEKKRIPCLIHRALTFSLSHFLTFILSCPYTQLHEEESRVKETLFLIPPALALLGC